MKRFEWRLQRVLDVAIKQEQVKKAELLDVTEKLSQSQGELLAKRSMLEKMIEALGKADPGRRVAEQEFFLKYSAASDRQIRRLEDRVSELESLQSEKISEVVQARRFREGLEKLRKQAKSDYIREQEHLEQKDADDNTTIRFARSAALVSP